METIEQSTARRAQRAAQTRLLWEAITSYFELKYGAAPVSQPYNHQDFAHVSDAKLVEEINFFEQMKKDLESEIEKSHLQKIAENRCRNIWAECDMFGASMLNPLEHVHYELYQRAICNSEVCG